MDEREVLLMISPFPLSPVPATSAIASCRGWKRKLTFTSCDANSTDAWDACAKFAEHLSWHKPRPIMLGPKIEASRITTPTNHTACRILGGCSNRLGTRWNASGSRLISTIQLWREHENESEAAFLLANLADANRLLGHPEEGIRKAEKALKIFERLGDPANQAECSINPARPLIDEMEIEAAEKAATHATGLLPEKGQQHRISKAHRILQVGYVYRSCKGQQDRQVTSK